MEHALDIEMRDDLDTGNVYVLFCQDEITQLWLFKPADAKRIFEALRLLDADDDGFAPEFDMILAKFEPLALDVRIYRMAADLSARERWNVITGNDVGGRVH